MHVAITGSSGLIGTALRSRLTEAGHRVSRVTRSGTEGISWNPPAGTIDTQAFEAVDAVVHLAGEGIGERRWTDAVKASIRDSRVDGTALLAETLAGLNTPPKVLLSGSAIGYYGNRGDEVLTETSAPGDDFLAGVTEAWERSTGAAEAAGIRVAHLRTGIVATPEGGALKKMLPLFRFGLGGKMGSGNQWWSWISIQDEVGLIEWLLHADLSGAVNLTAPRASHQRRVHQDPRQKARTTDGAARAEVRPQDALGPRAGRRLVVHECASPARGRHIGRVRF